MSGGDIESLEHELRPARGEPQGALVLLHGRGTDQFDLLPMLDELDPERRLVGVTPRGAVGTPARRLALVHLAGGRLSGRRHLPQHLRHGRWTRCRRRSGCRGRAPSSAASRWAR